VGALFADVFFGRNLLLFEWVDFRVGGINASVHVPIRIIRKFRIKPLMKKLLLSQHDPNLLQILRLRRNMDVPWVVDDCVLDGRKDSLFLFDGLFGRLDFWGVLFYDAERIVFSIKYSVSTVFSDHLLFFSGFLPNLGLNFFLFLSRNFGRFGNYLAFAFDV
jgi:hypothetical protein